MIPLLLKLKPIFRGILQNSFPGVAGVIQAIRNKTGVPITVTTATGEVVTGTAQPHSWWSIVPGILSGLFMLYMWHKGALSPQQVSDLFDTLLGLVK